MSSSERRTMVVGREGLARGAVGKRIKHGFWGAEKLILDIDEDFFFV